MSIDILTEQERMLKDAFLRVTKEYEARQNDEDALERFIKRQKELTSVLTSVIETRSKLEKTAREVAERLEESERVPLLASFLAEMREEEFERIIVEARSIRSRSQGPQSEPGGDAPDIHPVGDVVQDVAVGGSGGEQLLAERNDADGGKPLKKRRIRPSRS